MTDQEIVYLALENLQKQTQIQGNWNHPDQQNLDGKIVLHFTKKDIGYNIEIKNELRTHHLGQIANLNKQYFPFMLVAARLYPKIKEELRAQNIAYLEANGNMFLRNGDTLIYIDVNKALQTENKTTGRAFTKAGLKVLFLFLLNEDWLNATYRQLAEKTGTTIGSITNIINGLKNEGFLIPVTKTDNKLNNKKALLDKWITAYEQKLKPAIKIGTFRFLKEEDFMNWKKIPIKNGKTWWGGEPAGDLFTNYLRPGELTLYTTETRNDLVKNYRLIPDEKGKVKVFQKFWRYDEVNNNVVPPLLAYADLMNTGDRRCMETAQKIYDELLQNKF